MNYLNIVLIPQACQRSHENSTSWKINRLEAGVLVHACLWCVFVHAHAGNIQDSTYVCNAGKCFHQLWKEAIPVSLSTIIRKTSYFIQRINKGHG